MRKALYAHDLKSVYLLSFTLQVFYADLFKVSKDTRGRQRNFLYLKNRFIYVLAAVWVRSEGNTTDLRINIQIGAAEDEVASLFAPHGSNSKTQGSYVSHNAPRQPLSVPLKTLRLTQPSDDEFMSRLKSFWWKHDSPASPANTSTNLSIHLSINTSTTQVCAGTWDEILRYRWLHLQCF